MKRPIYEISFVSSNEKLLVQSINNTTFSSSSSHSIIHHVFVSQVIKHPQMIAVELDDQSLTYAELLHSVQLLSLTLFNVYGVSLGEMICQCVERSLTMVSCSRKESIVSTVSSENEFD